MPCAGRSSRSAPSSRSEEHTSELQSQSNLVCRLLLEKKKTQQQAGCIRQPSPYSSFDTLERVRHYAVCKNIRLSDRRAWCKVHADPWTAVRLTTRAPA